ncbi:MAG: NfeD family protein [Acidobacteriota bacterium]
MTWIIVIGLLVLGFVLVTIEALTPGVHIFGVGGGLMVLAGIVYATVKMGPAYGAGTMLVSLVIFGALATYVVKSGTFRHMTLESAQHKDQGYRADNAGLKRFLGKQGTVLHDLRPVGYVEIAGERVEAVSESDFVVKGKAVEVVKVDGVRLVVRVMAQA